MIYKFLILNLLCFAFSTSAYADGSAIITVHVTNKLMAEKTISLTTMPDYIHFNIGGIHQLAKADVHGNFRFRISGIKKYRVFNLELADKIIISNYIEVGDHIKIDFAGDGSPYPQASSFRFSGKGSEKLIAKTKIDANVYNGFKEITAMRNYDREILDSLVIAVQNTYQAKLESLNVFKTTLSNTIYQQLQAGIYSDAAQFALGYFIGHRKRYAEVEDLQYLVNKLDFNKPKVPVAILTQSEEYLDYLQLKAVEEIDLKHLIKEEKPLAFCSLLIRQNDGILREKLLVRFCINNEYVARSLKADQVYAKALLYINNPFYRKHILNLSARRKSNALAYDFSLPDSIGRIVRLSDFRKKVVIIDCWFTGCVGCAGLNKDIERDVLPSFIRNPDVVFISICADKGRELWLSSVKSGKYTHSNSINLFTEGLGINHPFMKHYDFQGFPRLLLVGKDGRIVRSNMPRKTQEIITLIDSALGAK